MKEEPRADLRGPADVAAGARPRRAARASPRTRRTAGRAPRDVGNELKWIAEGLAAGVPAKVAARRKGRERRRGAGRARRRCRGRPGDLATRGARRGPSRPCARRLDLPEKAQTADIALSPDGKRLAFTAFDAAGPISLWIRDLDSDDAQPVPRHRVGHAFRSGRPIRRSVAFFADGKLEKREPDGTASLKICDAASGVGGTWNRDGTIVFAPSPTSGLFRVSAAGGKPEAVTKLDAARHESRPPLPLVSPRRPSLSVHRPQNTGRRRRRAMRPVGLGRRKASTDDPSRRFSRSRSAPGGHDLSLRPRRSTSSPSRFDAGRLARRWEIPCPSSSPARPRTTTWGRLLRVSVSPPTVGRRPPEQPCYSQADLVRSVRRKLATAGRRAGSSSAPYASFSRRAELVAAIVVDPQDASTGHLDRSTRRAVSGLAADVREPWVDDSSRLVSGRTPSSSSGSSPRGRTSRRSGPGRSTARRRSPTSKVQTT